MFGFSRAYRYRVNGDDLLPPTADQRTSPAGPLDPRPLSPLSFWPMYAFDDVEIKFLGHLSVASSPVNARLAPEEFLTHLKSRIPTQGYRTILCLHNWHSRGVCPKFWLCKIGTDPFEAQE